MDDFSFIKQGQTETAVKGSVRRKINSLPSIMNIFNGSATVEEEFEKNRIKCSFATANGICTLGFTKSIPTKPMTLLKGNQLDKEKSKPIALVLRRKSGEAQFSKVIIGGEAELKYYFDNIKDLLSENLFPSETLNADD